jgi:UDP-3-O-[3-hydroxymyristoyl] glucosamine N-acyltransferase
VQHELVLADLSLLLVALQKAYPIYIEYVVFKFFFSYYIIVMAAIPVIPVIPSATDPVRRGNLRIKSLSLRELESSLSLAVDLTVSNERLSFTSIKDGESPVNMFSALGSTIEIPTLSVSSTLCGDLSTSGITTLNELSVHGVSSQLSVNGYVFFEDILSVQGDVKGKVSLGSEVDVVGRTQILSTLSVGDDFTLNTHASIGGEVDIVGRTQVLSTLSVGGDATLASATSVGGEVDIVGRTQVLSTLSVGDDFTLDTHASVGGEVDIVGRTQVLSTLSVGDDVTVATKASVGGAVRLSSVLNVGSSTTLEDDLSVGGFTVLKDSLSVGGAVGMISERISVGSFATVSALSAGATTLLSAKVQGNLSIAGNLVVEGTTTTINTSQIDIEDPIIEIGDGEALCGVKIIKDGTGDESGNQSGMFREAAADDGTPAFFAFYEDFDITSDANPANHVKNVGNLRIQQLSASGEMYLSSTASIGGAVDIVGRAELLSTLSVGDDFTLNTHASVGGEVDIVGRTQVRSTLSVGGDATLASAASVGGEVDIVGRTQVLSTLSVGADFTLNTHASVGGEVDIVGRTQVLSTLSVGSDFTLNTDASVGGNTTAAGFLSLGSHATIEDSLSVADMLVVTPLDGVNIFTLSAPVLTLSDSDSDVLFKMLFDEEPTSVTVRKTGKTDIIFTPIGTSTAAAITYDSTISKFVVNLQYTVGTATPVQTPSDIVVVMPRGYVRNGDFTVVRVADGAVIHDPLASVNAVDIFAAGSGEIIPTLSLAGDAVISTTLSVGFDMVVDGTTLFSDATAKVGILGTLSVNDNVNLNKHVTIGGLSDDFLSVGCDILGNKSLSVGGSVFMNDTASVGGNVDIEGTLRIGSDVTFDTGVAIGDFLSVNGASYFAAPVTIEDVLSVQLAVTMDSTLNVTGRITGAEVSCQNAYFEHLEVIGTNSVVIDGPATFRGDADINFEGNNTLNVKNNLSVGTDTFLNRLSVGSNTSFLGIVEIANDLSVSQNLTLETDLSVGGISDFLGEATLHDKLNVAKDAKLHSNVSVGGNVEISQNTTIRGLQTVNGRLSVGGGGTLKNRLSVGDTITGGRDLSVGHLILDSTRTHNRYFLTTPLSNTGVQVELDGENVPIIFSSGITVSSVDESGQFFVRTPLGTQIEWFELPSDKSDSNILSIIDRNDSSPLSLDLGSTVLAGITALSVGHDMILGITGQETYLSVGSRTDIVGRTQILSTLSVGNDFTLNTHASVGGEVDIVGRTQVLSTLSVGGDATLASAVSVGGEVDIVGRTQVLSTMSVGGDATLASAASVGGEVDIVGRTQVLSTLSVGSDFTLNAHASVGGEVDIVGRTQVLSTLSVQDKAYLSSSLSVANMIMTPEVGSDNTFILTDPIDGTSDAVHFYVDLRYPHSVVLKTAAGDIVFTQTSQAVDDGSGGQIFRSTFSNSAGIASSGGQVNGFTISSSSPFLNYMTPLEVLGVSTESGSGAVTVIHTPALGSSALTGGKKVPSLSVGGEIVVLESVSVGFDVTVSESLSVNKHIVSNTVSCANAFTSTLSTNSLFVQTSILDDITGARLSIQNAFFEHVEISGQDALSVAGKVELSLPDVQFLSTGMNMGQDKQLSIGGETFLNFLSVSMSHIDTLSVANTIASEISVHTLFVQQVTTNDPDESFGFHDDAVFQGDLTIEGKLFVSDILYTGPGGQFTIDNVARLTVEGVISTAGLIFEMTTPTSSSDGGTQGQMAVDTQFLYVCVQDNTWRRVTFSAF